MYEQYLRALLAPLGVYDMASGSRSSGELAALGGVLDEVSEAMENAERESLPATARGIGLTAWESLFAHTNSAASVEGRRAALAALMQVDGDSLTPAAIDRSLWACGMEAQARELGSGTLEIRFPTVVGIPDQFAQIEKIVLDLLPCHLAVEFFFRYQTWAECAQQNWTWGAVESAGHTWTTFQKAVPED